MAAVERLVDRLKELQTKAAEEGLDPDATQKTEFHYGRACGVQVGLKLALQEVENLITQDQKREE